MSKLRKSTL